VPSAVSAARLKAVPQKTYTAPIKQAVNVVDETKRIPFEALTAHSCRWPIGNPNDPDFGYCGEKKLAGKSYCAAHYERSITKCLHKT
jgi:GcrA cell cycle regulator